MILSIVNKAVSNFFHFSAENSYLFGIHKIIALAGLIQFPFAYRGRKVVDANNIEDGYYYAENGSTNTNGYFGFLLSAKSDQSAFQILVGVFTGTPYQRAKISNGQWTEWKEL